MKLLAWLRSFFPRRADRELFVYFDGERQRGVDPLKAWRGIWAHKEIDLASDVKVSANLTMADGKAAYAESEVYAAEDRIRQLTREVFGVKEWTDSTPGLTVAETDRLLADFLDYMEGLKKKRKTLPMMSPASASNPPPSLTASVPVESPTKSPSDCGCTGSESSAAEPSGS